MQGREPPAGDRSPRTVYHDRLRPAPRPYCFHPPALILVLTLPCLLVHVAVAQAPVEIRFVERPNLPDSILTQTVGIANIAQDRGTASVIPRYARTDNGFLQNGYLNLCGCVPFSRYGYFDHHGYVGDLHSTAIGGVARFPVVETSGSFIRIVTNPHINSSAWVEHPPEGGSWGSGVIWIDSIWHNRAWLDLFFFAASDTIAVYDGPLVKPSGCLRRGHLPGPLRAVEQEGAFIRVEAEVIGPSDPPWETKPIGWIRVRDTEGRLIVWVFEFDPF